MELLRGLAEAEHTAMTISRRSRGALDRARKKSKGRASPALRKPTVVALVAVTRGRQTTIVVRSLRSGRALFECSTRDARGAELAVLAAERYVVERGFVLVMPANDTAHAPAGRRKAA